MTKIDQFESIFRAAEKPAPHFTPVRYENVAILDDLDADRSAALQGSLEAWPSPVFENANWSRIEPAAGRDIGQLLDGLRSSPPDLVITYRHVFTDGWKWPYGLGEHVDVLTQALTVPVLVLPHPESGRQAAHTLTDTDRVMAMTDHLAGDDQLLSTALSWTSDGGTCQLAHVIDGPAFENVIATIGKIPEIETDVARAMIEARLRKEPEDFIARCREMVEKSGLNLELEGGVSVGHRLSEYTRLVEEHEVDVLVMHTKDDDQLAMHGLSYPLAVELRSIPLLLL